MDGERQGAAAGRVEDGHRSPSKAAATAPTAQPAAKALWRS